MASRLDFSQIRSLYVGTSSSTQVGTDNLVVAGNVGIGTTSPQTKFHVHGYTTIDSVDVVATFSSDNTAKRVNIGYSTSGDYGFINAVHTGVAWKNLIFGVNGGNVGIGTTAPTTLLQVASSQTNSSIRTGGLEMQSYAVNNSWYAENVYFDGSSWRLRSNGYATQMYMQGGTIDFNRVATGAAGDAATLLTTIRLNNTGNVLIGTTTDAGYKLRVNGKGYFDNNVVITPTSESWAEGLSFVMPTTGTWGGLRWRRERVGNDGNWYIGYTGLDNTDDLVFGSNNGGTQVDNIIRLTKAGNVGIGTTAPSYKLEVNGLAAADRYILNSVPTNSFQGSLTAIAGDSTYNILAGPANGPIIRARWSGGTANRYLEFGQTDNGGNYTAGVRIVEGNVGIGTTAPNAKLDVAGGINTRNTRVNSAEKYPVGHYSFGETVFEIDPTWTEAQLQDFFNVSGVSWVADSTAPGGYAIQIDGSANVGAGEYDSGFPYIPVDNSQDDWYYMECYIKNDAGSSIQHYMGGIDFNQNFASLGGNPGSYTYNVMFNYNPGTSWTKVYGYWNGFGSSYGSAGTGNTNNWVSGTKYFTPQALFNYGLNSGIRRCYISGWKCVRVRATGNRYYSNNVLVSGNVGVGTTAPDAKLVVTGDGSGTAKIGPAGFGGNYTGISLNGTLNTVSYNFLSSTSDNHLYINRPAGNDIYFRLANNDQVAIKASGNVGIGTTAPEKLLHISGGSGNVDNLILESAYVSAGVGVAMQFNRSSGVLARIRGIEEGAWNGGLLFEVRSGNTYPGYNGATDVAMKIATNGNVGIGTTAPTARLTIGANTSVQSTNGIALGVGETSLEFVHATFQNGFGSKLYSVDSGNGITSLRIATRPNSTSWSDAVTIIAGTSGNGNVGIGTTSPSYKLDVSGSARVNSTSNLAMFVKTNSAFGAAISYEDSTTGGNDVVHAGAIGSNFYIATGYSEQMRVSSSGNVIIGSTTDAGYKLDVHGEILGRDDIRILNTFALILNGTDANWRIGRNTITDSGWLTGNTMQMVVFGGQTGQGFQVVNTNGTALFEIDGVAGASRFTNALGVGVNPSGTAGRIDASNDIVAYSTSDQRLKENITPIANALDKVKALTGVEFDWKEDTKAVHGYEGHDVGVIAQEVQAVLPEAVRTNDSGYLSVRYEKMIGLLVEAMKEQQNQIDELKAKLDGLTK